MKTHRPARWLICCLLASALAGCGGVDNTAIKPENPAPPPGQPPQKTSSTTDSAKLP